MIFTWESHKLSLRSGGGRCGCGHFAHKMRMGRFVDVWRRRSPKRIRCSTETETDSVVCAYFGNFSGRWNECTLKFVLNIILGFLTSSPPTNTDAGAGKTNMKFELVLRYYYCGNYCKQEEDRESAFNSVWAIINRMVQRGGNFSSACPANFRWGSPPSPPFFSLSQSFPSSVLEANLHILVIKFKLPHAGCKKCDLKWIFLKFFPKNLLSF